ncbi:UPF0149 family protein [Candidatus Palauibacter sp.]|uniref:UPF0149 family protein n=1 Tax=Candidatus Palauibacter sp. TaxID=3101350 RepID=UPI003AF30E79
MTELHASPTPRERAELDAFLSSPDRSEDTLSLVELEGFLFAVAAAPMPVMPSEWIEFAFGGEMPEFDSAGQVNHLFGILLSLYNAINADVRYRNGRLPDSVVFREEVEENVEPDAPLRQWSRGFFQGHFWLREDWEEFGDDLDEEWHAAVSTLALFADRSLAEDALEEVREEASEISLADIIDEAWTFLPHSLMAYCRGGVSIQKELRDPEHDPARPATRVPRPGRNEPCDCGSDRKYKKCCGRLRAL